MEENDTGEQSSILDLFEILNSVSRLEILTQRMATLVSYLFFKSNDDSERKVDLASLKDSYEDFHKEWISITQSSDTYVKNNKRLFYLIYDDGQPKIKTFLNDLNTVLKKLEEHNSISDREFEGLSKSFMSTIPHMLGEIHTQFFHEGKKIVELDEKNYLMVQKDILKILKNITEIASSSRMISFNAHIIAERAGGDIGKEFSVVAEGISKLTRRTNDLVDKAMEIIELEQ